MSRQKPKLVDVAALAGVHASTVSRALNPETRHLVSEDVGEKVRRAASALGYAPNLVAANLRRGRTGIIGVIISDLSDPIYPPIVRAIEDTLAPAGYAALVGNSDSNPDKDAALLERLLARGVDGLISATFRIGDPHIGIVRGAGVPLVAVLRDPGDASIPTIISDDADGIRHAVAHLVGLGHRDIAHLAGPQDVSTGVNRLRAFREGLAAASIVADPRRVVIVPRYRVDDGETATLELLARGAPPTAIVAANDMIALGAYRALRGGGLACPADVSVTGLNDMPLASMVDPPLSTIRTPTYRMGAEGAAEMLRILASRADPPRRTVITPTFIARSSTAPPRVTRG